MTGTPRILLIDDDPVSHQTLAELLCAAGFTLADDAASADLVVSAGPAGSARLPVVRLVKPVRIGALIAGIRAALVREAASAGPRIGRWRFDEAGRLLEDDCGNRVRLTDKEAAILAHLLRAGTVVTRDTLLSEVWGYSAAVTTHTLETHIYRLRRKIEADPARAELLVTEPGGYRLTV